MTSRYVIYSPKKKAWIRDLGAKHGFSGTKRLSRAALFSKLGAKALAIDLNKEKKFAGKDWEIRLTYVGMYYYEKEIAEMETAAKKKKKKKNNNDETKD